MLRAFSPAGFDRFRALRDSGLLASLEGDGLVVRTQESPEALADPAFGGYSGVVEHERLRFISHPYEWPFALLRRAALLHLDVQLRALDAGFVLSDASAYNVQFRGVSPVFIDVGSFRPYREGELWSAHRQFCDQFLNPLLLAAELGQPFQPWLRGRPEGIGAEAIAAFLPARRWLSLRHAMHVLLPAKAERHARGRVADTTARIREARLPREAYRGMLAQLRRWIDSLRLPGTTEWSAYPAERTYAADETAAKHAFVADCMRAWKPAMLWDVGCNDAEFTAAALKAGARTAIGFDADAGALELACARAERDALDLLPLYQDAADPSPDMGWAARERVGLFARADADAMMALALEHHLAIGRNVPLPAVVAFLAGLAPRGIVEFVPKSDPTVQRMLALKGDIFPAYAEAAFEAALAACARIVKRAVISASGRVLYAYER